jgi:enoyl-CoA hydratase/carnithine racemase
MSKHALLASIEPGIAVVTLQRPEAANSMSLQMLSELQEILEQLQANPSIRCVVVTGQGEKAFCAGADLKERANMDTVEVRRTVSIIRRVIDGFAALPMPVIAAVCGVALGGGTELALACDIRFAAKQAVFGLTETSLGIIPGAGGTQRLPRQIGKGRAKELIYTAKRITAQEAETLGLVEYVVDKEVLMDKVVEMARQITQNAPIAVTQAKKAIDNGTEVDLETGLMIEQLAYEITIPTSDRLEGLKAFKEKRTPQYKGK